MGIAEQPVTDTQLDAVRIDASEFPARAAPVAGGLRSAKFQAVVRRSTLEAIHQHGRESTEIEICGVLVGNVYRDACGPWLYVEAIIRGDAAEGHATQVTFKAETWNHIQREMEAKHGNKRIIGWYHTHPGFGIFLSGMDLFIQDNFFNLPWQIAFVYDPIGGDEGSFVWRGGKSEREPFLVDETVTIEESWDLARRGKRMETINSANMAGSTRMQRVHAWLHSLEPSRPWTVAAVVFVVACVLTGLCLALLNGPR